MSTIKTIPLPVITGIYARAVYKITGLSMRQIENLHPDTFGCPKHWTFITGGSGGMFYTVEGLRVLVERLHAAGHIAESSALSGALRGGEAEGGAVVGVWTLRSADPIPLHLVPAAIEEAKARAEKFTRGWAVKWEEAQS